jgi:branched-chain amino acid aminotransferase group I
VWAYVNGIFAPDREAVLSVHDRGLRYGDGVFDTLRVYDGHPWLLAEHVQRLRRSADVLGLVGVPSAESLTAVIGEIIARNGFGNALVRTTLTRGASEGWEADPDARPTLIVVGHPFSGYPDRMYTHGASVVVTATTRIPASALDPALKSLNVLPQVLAKREATARGADEAILCTEHGLVAEGSVSNVFCVEGGRLATPPASVGLLPGITRGVVIDLARRQGLACDEVLLTPEDLRRADEVFLTGTGMEVLPVTRVDGQRIGDGRPGAVTSALRRWYQAAVRERVSGAR